MDPYLERYWNDVHNKRCGRLADEPNERPLPPQYRATMIDRVLIADRDQPLSGEESPDVAVLDWPSSSGRRRQQRSTRHGCWCARRSC